MYDPTLGRWLQQDPAGYLDGMNFYEYEIDNPNSFQDPTGRLHIDIAIYIARILARYGSGRPGPEQDAQYEKEKNANDKQMGPRAVLEGVKSAGRALGYDFWSLSEYNYNFAVIDDADYVGFMSEFGSAAHSATGSHDGAKTEIDLGGGFSLAFYCMESDSEKVAVIHNTYYIKPIPSPTHVLDFITFNSGGEVNGDIAEEYGGFSIVSASTLATLSGLMAQIYKKYGKAGVDMVPPVPQPYIYYDQANQ